MQHMHRPVTAMKITSVLLICSISAAVALPPGTWVDTLRNYNMDQSLHANDMLNEQAKSVKADEKIKFVLEPRGIIHQPETLQEVQKSQTLASFSASLKNYLARLMQAPGCPAPPDCYVPLPEDICGLDERTIFDNPVGVTPNQWICRVVVEATGDWWLGSAYKVKISPDVGRTVLFTAAHVLRNRGGGYVPRIRVQCPGEAEVAVVRNNDRDMWMSDEFLLREDYDYDYAYFTYVGNSNTGFGLKAFMNVAAIRDAGMDLHNCGYPAKQNTCVAECTYPGGLPIDAKQYCDQGSLINANDYKIFADVDIDFGQSGSPLYEITGNNYVAYGFVSLPAVTIPALNCPGGRRYERITAEKLYDMFSHMGGIDMDFRIKSSHNVYLHMDGAGLNAANRVGGNVFAGPSNADDQLKIFPVYQSSSNQPNAQLFAIRSANQANVYLRMDGAGVTADLYRGGGTVNCRYGIDDGATEVFHKEVEPDGQVAFRSNTFNNIYLRIDPWEIVVNAKFGKATLETQHLEEIP